MLLSSSRTLASKPFMNNKRKFGILGVVLPRRTCYSWISEYRDSQQSSSMAMSADALPVHDPVIRSQLSHVH